MTRFRSCWWLGALLVTSACNLNPRPEDPGANKNQGPAGGFQGAGGSSSVPSSPSDRAADAGAKIPPTGGNEIVPHSSDAGTVSDAGATDAGAESGSAMPDGPLP